MINHLKLKCDCIRNRLKDNSFLMLVWLLDFCPRIGGFPLRSDKISAIFMILHVSLLFYVCIVGTVAHLMYVADGFFEFIITFFNVFIIGVIMNNTLWFWYKKKDLKELLSLAMKNDSLLVHSGRFVDDYKKLLKRIKTIIVALHVFHFINDILIYIPTRVFFMDKFSIVSCAGLDLSSSPSIEVCMTLLASQELTSVMVVVAYDATVLFIFSHTTAVYQILYQDIDSFTEIFKNPAALEETTAIVTERLRDIIVRHSALLKTVKKMQEIYNVAVGYGFIQNAVSLCLFFVLPIEVSLNFGPLIFYSVIVFFFYCYYGQKLTNTAEKFGMAVYGCGWEKLGAKEQKLILLMLKQAQKPVVLKAASMVPISVYTFAIAMQSIYKFVAIFKIQRE